VTTYYMLVYDPETGAVKGRVSTTDLNQAVNYPNAVPLTREDFDSQPEVFQRVDPATKRRITLTAEEVEAKGVKRERIEQLISEGKITGRRAQAVQAAQTAQAPSVPRVAGEDSLSGGRKPD
jgi:hypothetical protein